MQFDPDLISGFLAALNNFSQAELRESGIESIFMSGLSWVYLNDNNLSLLLIAADKKSANPEVTRSRLDVIKNIFVQTYNITPEFWTKGPVNTQMFVNFAETLDTLREQWAQAEKAMDAAPLFDMLGIFQQILNLLLSIIRSNFFGEKYNAMMGEIQDFSKQLEEAEKNPELHNISFDPQQGWNVITLNPILLDDTTLKRALFKITKFLKTLIVKNLAHMLALSAFNKEIIPYILSNWELLEKIGVTKPLLEIFLERTK